MGIVGMILLGVGGILGLITGVLILVEAFKESILWGLGSVIVPFVVIIFVLTHWSETGKLFLYNLGAGVLLGLGAVLAGMGGNMPVN